MRRLIIEFLACEAGASAAEDDLAQLRRQVADATAQQEQAKEHQREKFHLRLLSQHPGEPCPARGNCLLRCHLRQGQQAG